MDEINSKNNDEKNLIQPKETENLQPELNAQKVIIPDVSLIYKTKNLDFAVCDNLLIGSFDEKFNYSIKEIIINELINLDKTIELKDLKHYKASATLDNVQLNFVACIEDLPDGNKKATLKLVERLVVAKVFTTKIITFLKSLILPDTPDFLLKVKKAFRLFSKDDILEVKGVNDIPTPPIELLTEILRKKDLKSKYYYNRDQIDGKYVVDILKILKNEPSGVEIIKNFIKIIKVNKLEEVKQNKMLVYRQLLDKLIADNIANSKLSDKVLSAINEKQNELLESSKTNEKKYEETMEAGVGGAPSGKVGVFGKPAGRGGKGGNFKGGNSKGGSSRSGGKGGSRGGNKGGKSGSDKKASKSIINDIRFSDPFKSGVASSVNIKTENGNPQPSSKNTKVNPTINGFVQTYSRYLNQIVNNDINSTTVTTSVEIKASFIQVEEVTQITIKKDIEKELDNNFEK